MPETTDSPYFRKDPLAEKLLSVSWEAWLARKSGVTLVSCTVQVTPSGLTAVSPATVSGSTASTELTGGTLGTTYEVAFLGAMSNGEVDVQRLLVAVQKIPVGLA